jgi:hypothetical protein
MSVVRIDFDDRKFQRQLRKFLELNKRDNGVLIEKQARKVCLGVGGVKGIRQLAWEKRATPSEIRSDMAPLLAGWLHRGGRAKKEFVRFRGRAFKGFKSYVLKTRQKKSGWISKCCAIRGWNIPRRGRTSKLKSAMNGIQILVRIATENFNPSVVWESRYKAFNIMDKKYGMTAKALRNGTKDMEEYIANKLKKTWDKV